LENIFVTTGEHFTPLGLEIVDCRAFYVFTSTSVSVKKCGIETFPTGPTINIPYGYFPIFCAILIYLIENEKRKLHYKFKHHRIIAIGYFVVIRTKRPVGKTWKICQRLLIERKHT